MGEYKRLNEGYLQYGLWQCDPQLVTAHTVYSPAVSRTAQGPLSVDTRASAPAKVRIQIPKMAALPVLDLNDYTSIIHE